MSFSGCLLIPGVLLGDFDIPSQGVRTNKQANKQTSEQTNKKTNEQTNDQPNNNPNIETLQIFFN